MEELQISEAARRRIHQVTAFLVAGAVIGGAAWYELATRRWWEQARPFTPWYLGRYWHEVEMRGRNARRALHDARVAAHDVSSAARRSR
ncbi:MAG TPA: hypothetical protein VID47_12485 [Actinomycetota bacterium]|jgi:hypothetical protein